LFSDQVRSALLVAAATAVSGCELAETTVPSGSPRLVVHAVLSPTAANQVLLLERTWDGSTEIWKTGRAPNPSDPIGTGGGYGEVLAEIEVIRPDGSVVRATEARFVNTIYGAGLYFLNIPSSSLTNGGSYQLRVRSSIGEELAAETTLPVFPPNVTNDLVTFDRQRDTLVLTWPPLAAAPAYHVVIDGPYGQTSFFTDSSHLRLTGSLRNVSVEGLPRVFQPGFTQSLTIAAIDSNYYGYFRSSNHSQTGMGLVNRVRGGFGVFGASAPVVRRRLRVVAPFDDPVEGNFRYLGTAADSARTLMIGLTVYVESKSSRATTPDAISGTFAARPGVAIQATGGFLGTRYRDSLTIAFLNNQTLADTIDVFKGRLAGDTIIGEYRFRVGTWRFLRQR
jgi:hypothetical protein